MSEPKQASVLQPSPLARVERAAGDLRRGLAVLVRAADGARAFCFAAEFATAARIARLAEWSGARPDVALTHQRAATLKIRLYTPEIVRVPLGLRMDAPTVQSLADPQMDLAHPLRGPFEAKREPVPPAVGGAIKLVKLARLLPAAVTAPAPAGFDAAAHDLLEISCEDIHGYDVLAAQPLSRIATARVPLAAAENSRIIAFRPADGGPEHLAIVIGDPTPPVLVRLHSECFTGDLLGSLKCDCGQQLQGAIQAIARHGAGVLLYLAQEGRGIGLINKLRAYALQDQGFDTVEANRRLGFEDDERLFLAAAEMLRQLAITRVRLMTNNPDKVAALARYGIDIVARMPHTFTSNSHNAGYLATKAAKSGHLL
ncbi:MAG: GTP cyclohydrolase II [Alphaproteobacteria bacterium]|nr:GTP cyclohydrolase II [Alphaproteobacteria bacterium]